MLVIVAPGQGAQSPGFLAPWLENEQFATRLAELSTVAGLDLGHYGTEADADTIRDTKIAQPLLVGTGLAAALELFPVADDAIAAIGAVGGHSVGELAAAAIAGAISAEDAMVLVRERGKAMADAAALTPTGMTAILGGDRTEVLASLDKHGLTPANDNGPGQIVAAGTVEQLAALAEDPPAKARLIPLTVAGAFHTDHMAPAVAHVAELAQSVSSNDARIPLISNRDGQVIQDGAEVLSRIVGQIASPVRWDLCLETMSGLGVTGVLELPQAGTLTGIAKRALKGVDTFALKTPDQLTRHARSARSTATGASHERQADHRQPGGAVRDHPGHRCLPAIARDPQRRHRRRDRLQRRVDPAAIGHQAADVGRRVRNRAVDGRWRVAPGPREGRH